MSADIRHYIYIDKNAVASIYEQIMEQQHPTKIRTTDYTGKILNAGMKNNALIASVISANVEANIETNRKIEEEIQINLSIEKKIDQIIKLKEEQLMKI